MRVNSDYLVGIIGAGVMGEALLVSIIKSGVDASNIAISDKRIDRTVDLASKYGGQKSTSKQIALTAQNILLVVKPQDVDSLLQ